jgi:hypothetical protein
MEIGVIDIRPGITQESRRASSPALLRERGGPGR